MSSQEKSVSGEQLAVSRKEARSPRGLWITASVRALLCVVVFPLTAYRSPLTAVQIQDNSFLIEEAYNQERGIVQHISTFERLRGGDWAFGFTQEWPVGGIRHQLSYTLPVQNDAGGTGLGDIGLNYRHQLVGNPEAAVVFAPRLSLLLPAGDHQQGRGAGALGFQTNLPLSLVLRPEIVSHLNAGATITPSAKSLIGAEATTADFNLGASVIWLLQPSVNLMLEALWLSTASVAGAGETVRDESLFLNPGIRLAFDLVNDLQIVPGVAYTFDIGRSSDEDALFLYLSLEHPFKR
ncbi:MAG: transporter [Gemmatimonadales bacterium]|nr:transporter [Gemmatimonadales bacterium]